MEDLIKEAKEYAGIPLNRDIDDEERYFNSNCVRYDDFIAGVNSKYVQKKIIIAQINILLSQGYTPETKIIIELERQLNSIL